MPVTARAKARIPGAHDRPFVPAGSRQSAAACVLRSLRGNRGVAPMQRRSARIRRDPSALPGLARSL